MQYKLLASDYDNTLVPFGEKRPRPAVEAAVRKMQAAGANLSSAPGGPGLPSGTPASWGPSGSTTPSPATGRMWWTAAARRSMSAR